MSRSNKKIPICGCTSCKSEKSDKQFAHKKFRRVNKVRLTTLQEFFVEREISNLWRDYGKDGKWYVGALEDKEYLTKLMRK